MAQLIIAAAGAAIGGAMVPGVIAAGITGAQAGWIVGSLVGSAFAPAQKVQGPRLSDLSVSSSAYGTPIPYVQGAPRLAGQIVWSSSKREIATTTRSGGKGGAKQKVTTYTYEVDLLILLCDNLMPNVTRIWSNGKLIWNKSATADAGTIAASDATSAWTRIAFYSGAASQLPDPTYEAAVGTANAPAYRGRGTVFIQGLQLGSAGQIPNLTFELSDAVAITVGAEFFSSNAAQVPSAARIADDRALAIFQNAGTDIWGRVIREAGISSSNSISFTNAGVNDIIPLTATTFLAAWNTNPATNIKAVVLTATGSPATSFTVGTEVAVDGTATSSAVRVFLGFISATQALAVWGGSTNGEFRASVLGISGTTITPGTIYPLFSGLGLGSQIVGLAQLTPTSAVAVVRVSQALYTMTISISGTVVTMGTPVAVAGASSNVNGCSLVAMSSATALLAYQHSTTELRTLTVSGSGVASAPQTVLNEYVQAPALKALSSSVAVCAWWLGGSSSGNIRAMPLGSSGAAAGAAVTVSSASPGSATNVVALSASKAMVMWRNGTYPFNLTYNTLTVA